MFSILGKIGWFFKEYKWRYMISIPMLLVASIFSILPPKIIGNAINHISNATLTREILIDLLMGLGAIAIFGYIVSFVWAYLLFGSGFILEYIFRKKFFEHILKMDTKFFEKNLVGDLMAKATVDLNQLQFTASRGILMLMETTTYLLFILITMAFTISFKLTILAVIPIPFVVFYTRYLGQKIHEYVLDEQNRFGELNDLVLESVSGVRVIRAYTQEENDVNRLDKKEEVVFNKAMKVFRSHAKFEFAFRAVYGFTTTIAIGYGTFLIFQQEITAGDLVSFMMYLGMLGWPLFAMGQMVNIMQRGNASYDRISEVFNQQSDVLSGEGTINELDSIKFNHYTFTYPLSEKPNISDLTFEIKKGKTLGIVGKTGSGKSTIVKQLLREYAYGSGDILVNDNNLEDMDVNNVRSLFGYVPQDHVLFSGTVTENIKLGNVNASNTELSNAINNADFKKDVEFLTEGLETTVGEDGVMLSGGQKQRLQIARALINDPEILILDDSLSAVDGKTEQTILTNLKNSRSDKTNIIIAHRLSAVEHADEIIVLDEGKIIDRGTHHELINRDGWYKEQYEIQQMGSEVDKNENV